MPGTIAYVRVFDRPVDSTRARTLYAARPDDGAITVAAVRSWRVQKTIYIVDKRETRRERRDMHVSRSNRFFFRSLSPESFCVREKSARDVFRLRGRVGERAGGAFRRVRFGKHVRAQTGRNSPGAVP